MGLFNSKSNQENGGWISKSFSKRILIVVFLITVGFVSLLPNLKFDYNFRKFFPSENSETVFFKSYQQAFKTDNDFVLIALESPSTVFEPSFLNQAKAIQLQLAKHHLVVRTQSLFTENHLAQLGGNLVKTPCLSLKSENRAEDSIRIFQRPELIRALIDEQAKSMCILVFHQPGLSPETGKSLIATLHQLEKKKGISKVTFASRITGEDFYVKRMSYELILFVTLSSILVLAFLIITFRSFWGVALPMILLVLVVIWVVGLMVVDGIPMNILLTMLPSILFVVTMSDVIHLVAKYQENIRKSMDKIPAMKKAVKEVGLATFFTCFNTAIGFITLGFVGIEPIKVFGIVTGIGVVIAFVLTMLVLPALLIVFPTPRLLERKEAPFWSTYLRKLFLFILKKRKWVMIVSIVFISFGIIQVFQIETNAYLMDNVKSSEPIKQDFDYIDAHYGGVRPFEMGIELKNNDNPFSYGVLKQMQEIESYLSNQFGVKITNGLAFYSKIANRTKHGGNPDYYSLPKRSEWKTIRRMIKGVENGKLKATIVNDDETILRISGLIPDWGSKNNRIKMNQFDNWFRNRKDAFSIVPHFTGSAYLYDKTAEGLSDNILQGLTYSIGIVGLVMAFIFRSWVMGFLSVIPNLIPLVALTSIMSLLDIELKISTALVFTISFGIAVDDTIHFLSKFRHEIKSGRSTLYALKASYLTTGKAMILTAVLLCFGFLTMVFSSFLGTFYMGLMVSFSLLIALVADLILLPVLLLLFYRKPARKSGM